MSGVSEPHRRHRDVIIIGSSFGGALAAWPLVHAGRDVLMLERGPWVRRGPENWEPDGTLIRTPYFNGGSEFRAHTAKGVELTSTTSCVGGASVFYGAVSLRYRERDFLPDPEIVTDSGAEWPIRYADLQHYYQAAERILGVAGRAGVDPTEPARVAGYAAEPTSLSEVSRRIGEGARSLGLRPFPLPLAISFANGAGHGGRAGDDATAADGGLPFGTCVECATCDTFACAVGAKNDVASRVLPRLIARGLELRSDTAVTGLVAEKGRVTGVRCEDRRTGETYDVTADVVVLAAGALSTPHLLLAAGLHERNPAGDVVGRYLTRHCAAIVYGAYPWIPSHSHEFHKQLGIHDYYFGDDNPRGPSGKLGGIQQVQTPSMGTVEAVMPRATHPFLRQVVTRVTGLLVLAEERPQYDNHVRIVPEETDDNGLPRLEVEHRYADRDLAARRRLIARAREIHRAVRSPAQYAHRIDTFSHALGTVRMGHDPQRNPLDADCRFRGLENLYVADGSALPTGGGVNPSLTIAANALRVGAGIVARGSSDAGKRWRARVGAAP
ncbi:MAG: GMC family oxidoreductase [Gemmatimonadota bacterium]|nr:GMC family oxidoreductase [Gemmatimonadota bacterium]